MIVCVCVSDRHATLFFLKRGEYKRGDPENRGAVLTIQYTPLFSGGLPYLHASCQWSDPVGARQLRAPPPRAPVTDSSIQHDCAFTHAT